MANVRFTQFPFVSTGTTTARTQPDRNAQYIMLEDFGGVGDSSTDNVAAFNAAVAALGTQAVTVNLDPTLGYAFSGSITLPINWSIDGHVGSVQHPLPGLNSWDSGNAKAVNYVQFTKNPTANETITLNGTVVTFVAGVAVGNQVQIAGTMNTTVTNLAAFLNASADAQISKCTYASGNWLNTQLQNQSLATFAVLEITFDTAGTGGNSFTLGTFSNTAPFQKCGGPASVTHGTSQLAAATNSTTLRYGGLPTNGGTLIFNAGGIVYSRGCSVRNCFIYNGSVPSNFAGPVNALANIVAFSGTALSFATAFSAECSFSNLMIVGFDTAITCSGFSQSYISTVMLDCRKGIFITATNDVYDIERIRANSHYTGGYTGDAQSVDCTYRKGAFIHLRSIAGGGAEPRCYCAFSYGHAIKFLAGGDFETTFDQCGADGPGVNSVTPCLLNILMASRGSGYSAAVTATCSPSKGETLVVTLVGGVINGITVTDPGTWDGTETPPTIVITDGTGTGAVAAPVTFIRSIGFSTYGNTDRFSFISPTTEIQSYSMKLEGANGSHYITQPRLGPNTASTIQMYTGLNTTVYQDVAPVTVGGGTSIMGRYGQVQFFTGTGDPNGVVTAGIGSLFLRTDGAAATTLYVKTSGAGTNTVWTAK